MSLKTDKTQLAGQLLRRLLDFEVAEIHGMLEQAKQSKNSPWLWPLRANLKRPGEGCLRTLTDPAGWVSAVAIAPNRKIAVSDSSDRTLKIWDLLSGKEIASFSGDAEFDCCAIAPDRVTVVAGDRGCQVHFLRLEGVISISE